VTPLTLREHATILFALRYLTANYGDVIEDMEESPLFVGEGLETLEESDIEGLCEQLNTDGGITTVPSKEEEMQLFEWTQKGKDELSKYVSNFEDIQIDDLKSMEDISQSSSANVLWVKAWVRVPLGDPNEV
jgi:hypothetical protein